ncbi:uncharacterized protein K460DRAFT_178894 [Cucurbitaria berberidis CBS 394.84]|uniref:Uncharacterized protein n=1 Tax=Cucurbitaria berberidis CBS 394.84 TaxID=1168544 RepID=A0A9P4GAM0_9PLEO|nr:uncharacterized protein K460DRAFT_178894 [Cucurbitaria berberidis CBS 394.84]KAF1842102.1 hypothetical protein K460DRAFT_178894 [Cucurbitaria berberidis CBS 394.84]
MSKGYSSSFRICIAILLAVQAACWALTVLDLLSPGKPSMLLQMATNLVSQIDSRRLGGSALLSYRDIRSLI